MADDQRFRKFADYVVENYLDHFPPTLWADSPDLNSTTTEGCESYHAHFNASFYCAQPNIYLLVETLLRQQTSTYISLASHSRSRHAVRKNSRERSPLFCDACTLTTARDIVLSTCRLAGSIMPILFCLNVL